MKKSEVQIRKMKFYNAKEVCFLGLIIFVSFLSCNTEDEAVIVPIVDPEETVLNAPTIQTPSPLIHLADNLDEQDQLGWCIDTRGNGFSDILHLHSCKASGGDVQFIYNEETLQICSVEFADFCIEMSEGILEGMGLSLIESNTDSPNQKFVYNEDTGEFNPEEDTSLCIAAGETSAAAGIYMSRSLTLELSSETEESLKKWIIVAD